MMKSLLIKIELRLEDYRLERYNRPRGPLFHRWLPDGLSDAITLDTGNEKAELKVWFERRGFVRDGWVVFDYERKEVDPDVMVRQAVLDSGPLFGYLRIGDLTDIEYNAIVENKSGSQAYVSLGKRIIKLIFPPISRLVRLLRINFGQYWIPELEPWDSRKMSLGNYCHSTFKLSWSNDEGATWHDFEPSERLVHWTLSVYPDECYEFFLSEQDYRGLADTLRDYYEPSLGAATLAFAHRIFDEGNIRHAFIEAVIALELIIHEFIRKKMGSSTKLTEYVQSFYNLPLRAQFTTLSSIIDGISAHDIELATEAIDIRNKIVHEGLNFTDIDNARNVFMALLKACSFYLEGPVMRFPSMKAGNMLYSPNLGDRRSMEVQ